MIVSSIIELCIESDTDPRSWVTFANPFQVPSKNSLDQHVFTIKPERQIRWKKERTSKTNSGRNVRLINSIIQKLRKQSTVPTYNLRVYDYRLLKVLELTKMHLSYKRIFFGSLSVLVSRPRDRWKLDLQFPIEVIFFSTHPPGILNLSLRRSCQEELPLDRRETIFCFQWRQALRVSWET